MFDPVKTTVQAANEFDRNSGSNIYGGWHRLLLAAAIEEQKQRCF
ncbi:hypothetical protein DSM3645_12246 [Blastopirellula marina DSM 3645]|uniref:Uncharacterized protein n=1 Tax=Blastopirellula marina DSM 3645 TaxID=314230 RepID=A3ZRL9_9BACT|nr:hypothetical protein DSM3645_12246 [Blastopirellula marina DSM 3645]